MTKWDPLPGDEPWQQLINTSIENDQLKRLPGGIGFALEAPLSRGQRGAVIADDFGIRGRGPEVSIYRRPPDLSTYKAALLFNDALDMPVFQGFGIPHDLSGLTDAGIVRRSGFAAHGVLTYENLTAMPFYVYRELASREPGAWALWRPASFDPVPNQFTKPNGAVSLAIRNALIVPADDVPIVDVIEFRERNRKQLLGLREHLERLIIKLANCDPNSLEARVETEALDRSIAEYLEEARKPNWKKALGSLELSMNWSEAVRAIIAAAPVAFTSIAAGLPITTAAMAIGGPVLATLGVSSTRGLKSASAESPFEYLASIEREFG